MLLHRRKQRGDASFDERPKRSLSSEPIPVICDQQLDPDELADLVQNIGRQREGSQNDLELGQDLGLEGVQPPITVEMPCRHVQRFLQLQRCRCFQCCPWCRRRHAGSRHSRRFHRRPPRRS